jgi:hypothetical protein
MRLEPTNTMRIVHTDHGEKSPTTPVGIRF